MKRFAFVCIPLASLLATYLGCGGASPSDVTIAPGDGGADGASGDGASSAEGGSSGFTDAAPKPGTSGGAANDGGPGGSATQLPCGTATCALATDFCCVYQNQNAPPEFLFGCASGSACPAQAGAKDPTALLCSGAANCGPGAVCCVRDDGNRVWSECAATCTDSASTKAAQLCDPAAPATGCAASAPCSSKNIGDWNLPNGYATCGGRGN